MATVSNFDGKTIIEPGVYARTESGIPQAPLVVPEGDVMIIDTGSSLFEDEGPTTNPYAANIHWGGGSGINGANEKGRNSIYSFESLNDFRQFIRGGMAWKIAEALFRPSRNGNGVPKIWYVSAKTSTAATITKTFATGSLQVKTRHEGTSANGRIVTVGSDEILTIGYGAKLLAGTNDTSKYKMRFEVGTFRGYDASENPIDRFAEADTEPDLVIESPEVATIQEIIDWMKTSRAFNQHFIFDEDNTTIATPPGTIAIGDLDTSYVLATGGTETYSSTDLDDVLEQIIDVQNTFFLADRWGTGADGATSEENLKILAHIKNDSTFEKFLMIGGGQDATEFSSAGGSIEMCETYDDAYAHIIHSGCRLPENSDFAPQGYREYESVFTAALVTGRLAGLPSQIPGTFKDVAVHEMLHDLKKSERERALQAGLIHIRHIEEQGFLINQSVNTLQRNTQVVNPDGQSHEVSVMRISSQLNKELIVNGRLRFPGSNLARSSPAIVKEWVNGFLLDRVATETEDNLIVEIGGVNVKYTPQGYYIEYGYVPNYPVNKMFFTGFLLEFNQEN